MEEPVIITLSRHTSGTTKNRKQLGAGSLFFRFTLTDQIINHLGRQVKISLSLNEEKNPCFIISKFGTIESGTPNIICGKTVRVPTKIVDEWNDIGNYQVEFESESITLTKVNL